MSRYWIKLWVELLKDEKVGVLPDHIWRRMIECFLMAGLVDDNGRLPLLPKMAWITHQNEESLQKELEYLIKLGIVAQNDSGDYRVTKWEDRQRPASAAERMRRVRLREPLRYRNEIVTPSVTQTSPRSTEVLTTTTLNSNKKSSSSTEVAKIEKHLENLGIQDMRQKFKNAPPLVFEYTVLEILADHDPKQKILANLILWSEAKTAGVPINHKPALVWCKIVEGQPPPTNDNEPTWYDEVENITKKRSVQ